MFFCFFSRDIRLDSAAVTRAPIIECRVSICVSICVCVCSSQPQGSAGPTGEPCGLQNVPQGKNYCKTYLEFSRGTLARSSLVSLARVVDFLVFSFAVNRRHKFLHSGCSSNCELCCRKLKRFVGFQREVRFRQPRGFRDLLRHQRVTCSEADWQFCSQNTAQKKNPQQPQNALNRGKILWTLDVLVMLFLVFANGTMLQTDSTPLSATINHHFQAPTH